MPKRNAKKAQQVREYARKWRDHWKRNIAHYHEMTQFILGEQWKEDEAKLFEDYKKMPLTVNKIAPQVNHMLGEQRQNTPNLQIQPTDDVDEKTADVRAALVKEISLNSHARVIYQTVFEQFVIGGFSAYRIYTDYESDDSFNQEIKMASFKDPTKVFWDVGAESPCKTDGLYSGFATVVSRKKFSQMYGEELQKKIGTTTSDSLETDDVPMQISDSYSITIFDIFERKAKNKILYQLSNGRTVNQDEYRSLEKIEVEGKDILIDEGEPVTVMKERSYQEYKIVHSKWAGDYELEKTDFPSKQLPIPFADQKSFWDKNGKQITRSFFKDAKDSQRFLNYLRTQTAYLIKVSRYDQFLVSKQNVRGNDTQAMWRDPATQQGGLWYDESPNGNKPEQLRPAELPQSMQMQYEVASQDIQVTTGLFDTQMGKAGNEISGDAIDARTERGSYNTFVAFDALNRVIAVGGEIIDEMIPEVYDTERNMNLDMKDRGQTKVSLNKPMDEYGMHMENDMSKGKFKIRLVPGPSFEHQKTENLRSMDMVFSKNPGMFGIVADLYAENLPMANNIEMRNRLRTIVPPEIIEAGKSGKPLPPKPPQQDPMLMLKQQELQQKMMVAQMEAQDRAHKMQLEEQKMLMQSHLAGADYTAKLQELKMKEQANETALHEKMLSYQSEMARINADIHLGHSGNIQKILTHQPNHFKAEPPKKDNT